MTTPTLRTALVLAAGAAALVIATPSMAAMMTYKAQLSAANEVPPNDSKGTGEVTVTYDDASKKMTWKGTYSGLSGPATAAHFHGPAEKGKNAGVMVPMTPANGTLEGSATLTDDQAKALMSGDVYANVHTATNKAGEIRGQLTK
jgi:CHRD domain